LFPEASIFFSPVIFTLGSFGVISGSFSAFRQLDIKRIVAYSSVAHMNLVALGIFSFKSVSVAGAVFQAISHGFVSSGLFFLIGMLYTRCNTRDLTYYSGLFMTMPLFSSFFLAFTMANIALPGTSSFIGEFLLFFGIFQRS
jgi:hypothetical protein